MARSTIWLAIGCLALAAASASTYLYATSLPEGPQNAEVKGELDIGLDREDTQQSDEFNSASVLLWDKEAKIIRYEKEGFEKRPLASLTKLMSAMVLLDQGIDWEKEAEILPEEYVVGGKLLLHPGEKVTMRNLFHVALLGSANNAMLAMVRESGIEEKEFIRQMNRKAIALGLEQTNFVEVTGLDTDNVSNAFEAAKLAEAAFDYPEIAEASREGEYVFSIQGSGREHVIKNTNKLISQANYKARGSKTGYLYEAGYCLVMEGEGKAEQLIAVVLGSATEEENLEETRRLLEEMGIL